MLIVVILFLVIVSSVSCGPAGKAFDEELKEESRVSVKEQPPESNNYQGLRFETTRLEFSRVCSSFPRLVCLGDSVTFGWNIAYEKSFPYLLEKKLMEQYPGVMVINSGIGGQTVLDGLQRLESDVFYYDPMVVIINFGLNDAFIVTEGDSREQRNSNPGQTKGEGNNFESEQSLVDENRDTDLKNNIDLDTFTSTYRQLIERISDKGLEILIMGTNPVRTEVLWDNKDIASKQEESYRLYNQAARDAAEDYGIIFVDIWEGFMSGGELDTLIQPDGIHPGETGLVLISEILSVKLRSVDLNRK
ncbi:MAG: GDSL-type esterase/lipase family protein [Actinobacteria bacterium]|nr:GDSL-type esterase/lipase family protein [Actinomycetota bacterium]